MADEVVKETVEHPEEVKPPVEHTPPPVDPDAGKTAIEELKSRVTELEGVVQALTSSAPDSTPVSKPWTHRGFGKR